MTQNFEPPAGKANAISIRNLSKKYQNTQALDDLNLDLYYGQVVGLLGENGCGKTTLLKILGGVLADYAGDVQIAGHKPGPESKALVSFLPDKDYLPTDRSISYLADYFSDVYADFNSRKALELVQYFGLDKNMKLKQMSKGMREKAQIAMAMGREARVHLLDEPISGVDPSARQVILEGILRSITPDSLVVISTHLIHDLEPVLDSIVMMRHGRVLLSGGVDDLRYEHGKSIDELFREVYSWNR